MFIVPADAKGVTRKGYPTQDGLHAADITFTGVEVGADTEVAVPVREWRPQLFDATRPGEQHGPQRGGGTRHDGER
mgnify:CR=1 FL=1